LLTAHREMSRCFPGCIKIAQKLKLGCMGWFFWQPMINTALASRARAYISAMPSAISGQHGHDATFAVAKKLVHDFGMSEPDAWPILLDYNARCQPPWSERELRHKLHSAGNLTRVATRRGHLRHEIAKPAPPAGPAVSWTKTPAPLPKKPDAVVADMVKHSDHKEAGPGLVNLGNHPPPSPSSSSPIATRGASIPTMITHGRPVQSRVLSRADQQNDSD
jgi:hypothetical protein